MIDVVSKFAWVYPLSSKSTQHVMEAFQHIIQERKPVFLHTDRGKEFVNSTFQNFLKKHDIKWYATNSDIKASIVERFHRTFMTRLSRYNTVHAPNKRLPMKKLAQQIVKSYNNSFIEV